MFGPGIGAYASWLSGTAVGTVAGGWLERFLSATGPAAIATLFIASILPAVVPDLARLMPLITGTVAVLGGYFATRLVALATLGGAIVHGATDWMIG